MKPLSLKTPDKTAALEIHARFQPPASIITCKGRSMATYDSAAFIAPELAHRRPPVVVSLLVTLLCTLVFSLVCVLLMHPVNDERPRSASAQSGESLSSMFEEYDP